MYKLLQCDSYCRIIAVTLNGSVSLQQNSSPKSKTLSIGELADAAEVTRRVVRFYVQRGLLSPPIGKGRGSHYTRKHLEQLLIIQSLQAQGESLDAIKEHLHKPKNHATHAAPSKKQDVLTHDTIKESNQQYITENNSVAPRHVKNRAKAKIKKEPWLQLTVTEGVELHINASVHELSAGEISQLQKHLLAELNNITQEE